MGKLQESSSALLDVLKQEQAHVMGMYDRMLTETEEDARKALDAEIKEEIHDFKQCSADLKQARSVIGSLQDELQSRWHDVRRSKKRRFSAPSNAQIDYQEAKVNSFARGMNGYKIMLLYAIGSFVGVVIESLWCMLTRGYLESRAGLVYGPFNPLYGIGAVIMSLVLYRYRNRGIHMSFVGGMLTGAVVEYACSYFQELIFGSRSWDYSWMPFNLNGRICLLYCVFWGFLGVLWMKEIYPRLASWITRIPNRTGKLVTWILIAFFAGDSIVSAVAVYRWSGRLEGVAASNPFWEYVDERFPNERMDKVYSNMMFGDEKGKPFFERTKKKDQPAEKKEESGQNHSEQNGSGQNQPESEPV